MAYATGSAGIVGGPGSASPSSGWVPLPLLRLIDASGEPSEWHLRTVVAETAAARVMGVG
jgi:hypothetical protein